jgi:hypothetical protein
LDTFSSVPLILFFKMTIFRMGPTSPATVASGAQNENYDGHQSGNVHTGCRPPRHPGTRQVELLLDDEKRGKCGKLNFKNFVKN